VAALKSMVGRLRMLSPGQNSRASSLYKFANSRETNSGVAKLSRRLDGAAGSAISINAISGEYA
jgi:hypothetical protein